MQLIKTSASKHTFKFNKFYLTNSSGPFLRGQISLFIVKFGNLLLQLNLAPPFASISLFILVAFKNY
jgi:hypothetical protein